jgi:hypothetical protein
MMFVAEANIGVTGRGSWDMYLGSVLWAVGIVYGRALD